MREIRPSGSEGGGTNSIASPYPYFDDGPSGLVRHLRRSSVVQDLNHGVTAVAIQ
jgi:hypothetical protein